MYALIVDAIAFSHVSVDDTGSAKFRKTVETKLCEAWADLEARPLPLPDATPSARELTDAKMRLVIAAAAMLWEERLYKYDFVPLNAKFTEMMPVWCRLLAQNASVFE